MSISPSRQTDFTMFTSRQTVAGRGCQVFTVKPSQLLLETIPKLAESRFEAGSQGTICIPGAKCHVIGVASTRTWKTNRGNRVKVAQFRGKTAALATLLNTLRNFTSRFVVTRYRFEWLPSVWRHLLDDTDTSWISYHKRTKTNASRVQRLWW